MIPTKGSLVYNATTGEPCTVRGTRKLIGYNRGYVRVYLEGRMEFDVPEDGEWSEFCRYTPTQSAAQAKAWATKLEEAEEKDRQWMAEEEAKRLNRMTSRDLLNAPATYTPPMFDADQKQAVFTSRQYKVGMDGTAEHITRTHEVSIYERPVTLISQTGEYEYTREIGVSWASYGSMPIAFARQYAEAILAACDFAESLPTPVEALTNA